MSDQWDEFTKSVAEAVPRRQILGSLGAVVAAALLSPFGLEAAKVRRLASDPCKTFCKCRNKSQQKKCLEACNACNKNTSLVCGGCGTYVCCATENACCNGVCTDVTNDFYNCGGCGNACRQPGEYEYAACVGGNCEYWCAAGAVYCDGYCTPIDRDYDNCGACGNVCSGSTPYCVNGICTECLPGYKNCDSTCTDVLSDNDNCGACGNVCGGSTPYCHQGYCTDCEWGAICNGSCTDIMWDSGNCGACGNVCPDGTACSFGICYGICYDCGF